MKGEEFDSVGTIVCATVLYQHGLNQNEFI